MSLIGRPFRPSGRYLWDFWTLNHNGTLFLYYLTAAHDIDPETRHGRAMIGLATTSDLESWQDRGVVLAPSWRSWEDRSIWTGSVCRIHECDGGGFGLLYTANGRAVEGNSQEIGLARSRDAIRWERVGDGPVLIADPAHYVVNTPGEVAAADWRDPHVMPSAEGGYLAFICARRKDAVARSGGCVALARSADLRHWTIEAPVTPEIGVGHMECPHLFERDGAWHLLVSVHEEQIGEAANIARRCATLWFRASRPQGPFALGGYLGGMSAKNGLPSVYMIQPVIHPRRGERLFAGWRGYEPDGRFSGSLTPFVREAYDPQGAPALDLDRLHAPPLLS